MFPKKVYRLPFAHNSIEYVRERLAEINDGDVFLFDRLACARGRQGRKWHIQRGQLLLTFALKPLLSRQDAARLFQLAMALGNGFLEPILSYGVELKWPNDFMVAGKKVAGMLIEAVWQGDRLTGIIVGFGLNVNNQIASGDELACIATSLRDVAGKNIASAALLDRVLRAIGKWYRRWHLCDDQNIFETWRLHQAYLGRHIAVHDKEGNVLCGFVEDVLPDGNLLLKETCGTVQTVPFSVVKEVREMRVHKHVKV